MVSDSQFSQKFSSSSADSEEDPSYPQDLVVDDKIALGKSIEDTDAALVSTMQASEQVNNLHHPC